MMAALRNAYLKCVVRGPCDLPLSCVSATSLFVLIVVVKRVCRTSPWQHRRAPSRICVDLTLKTLPDPQFFTPWKGLSCEGAGVDRAERVTALPTTSLWIQYATEGVPSELGFHPQSFFAVPPHPLWSAVVLRLPKVLRYGHLFLRGVLGFGSSLTIPRAPDFTQRGLAARRTVFPPHDR